MIQDSYKPLSFIYINWKGEISKRTVLPIKV